MMRVGAPTGIHPPIVASRIKKLNLRVLAILITSQGAREKKCEFCSVAVLFQI